MNKKWEVHEPSKQRAQEISAKFNLGLLISYILSEKELTDEEIGEFLNPTRNDFYDPFEMPDMTKAVDRIEKAIQNQERICIYGDYDADGITSTTVLKRFFRDRGIEVGAYIPNRLSEGYGLNHEAVEKVAEEKYDLMITVDTGITAMEDIEYAKSLGIDVIVTDHHEPMDTIPDCIAVVDCKRADSTYKFRELCGCGVAFKLILALCKRLNLNENEALKYLDITAIGTISDIVPLVDENRVIAKLGIMLLKQTRNIGLKALIERIKFKEINSSAVAFGISPRINACGRMGHQEVALDLFLTDDPIEARNLAKQLEDFNRERQNIEKAIFEEADKMASKETDRGTIVLAHKNWHKGVIGIVSSKLTEKYFKPSILMDIEGKEAKGSGRSIPGFDLHEALSKCSTKIKSFGGHSMAIGLCLETKYFQDFKNEFENYAKENIDTNSTYEIDVDKEVFGKELKIKEIEELNKLEPFGDSNEEPVFILKGLKITSIRALSDGKHIKLTLKDDNNIDIDGIGFGLGEISTSYQIGDRVDVIGNLQINSFNGMETIQLNLKDIRMAL